jgi:uncharacterized protein (TIGR00255 family)
MLESMTGFATVEYRQSGVAFTLTIRSVNSRFLEVRMRLPKALSALEDATEKLIRAEILRGRLDLDLHIMAESRGVTLWRADLGKATTIRDGLTDIQEALGLPEPVQLSDIVRIGGLELFEQIADKNTSATWRDCLMEATATALRRLRETRHQEGKILSAELEKNIQELRNHILHIQQGVDEVLKQMRTRMRSKVSELLGDGRPGISPDRLDHEILLLIERADIREELVRLKAHLDAFEQVRLNREGPHGKRLDFLLQEILREVNTVGSKVPDAQIRNLVVDMKVLVEQLRQQVANIA